MIQYHNLFIWSDWTPQTFPLTLFITDDEIKKKNDLIQAVKDIGNWHGLCTNLGVSDGKMDSLKHAPGTVDAKKAECLEAYWKGGEAKWSDVVKAVVMHPIEDKLVAKKIAEDHGLDYNKIVKDEL